jgi:hypothetical protein
MCKAFLCIDDLTTLFKQNNGSDLCKIALIDPFFLVLELLYQANEPLTLHFLKD